MQDAKHVTFLVKGILDIGKAKTLAEVQAIQTLLIRYVELEAVKISQNTVSLKIDAATSNVPNKIEVIKNIRQITGVGLKDAKDLCELGGVLPKQFETSDALKVKALLERLGHTVDIIGGSEMLNILHGS